MRYLSLFVIVLIFFVSVTPAQKKKEKFDWKTGKITELAFKREVIDYSENSGPLIVARNDKETAMLETENVLYSISRRLNAFWVKKLKFNENDEVQYAIYKGILYIKDTRGKNNKFEIVEKNPK